FKNGKRHGQGTEYYGNGTIYYVGGWKDHKQHGQVTIFIPDGTKYVGGFKNGKRHGQGTITYGIGEYRGSIFIGEFINGKEYGQGILTFANGDKSVGEWKDGYFVNALTQEEAINNYLSDRELDPIEGVWIAQDNVILSKVEPGIIITIYKSDNNFLCKIIRSKKRTSGSEYCKLVKGSNEVYYSENSDLTFYLDNRAEKIEFTRCKHEVLGQCAAFKKLWPQVASSKTSSNAASGSAFFVNDKGNIITNFHVVEVCNDQSKIMYKDKEYPAKLIASDKKLDLALLKVELKNSGYLKLSYNPKKMQKIYAAGYPFGKYLSDDLKFTDGIISSLKGYDDNTNQLQISAAINPGNSGGPIINQSGELVGVAVSGLDKGATEGINFAIKS
ncbi:MAG: trypsin-like peptidase domain-containing protein, partial [SAR202 cluster bacterium]|nr:trypsin-like peptidase domain-containing protein [SAR202 cluster bacterium]